jgi:hypothetical protein
VTLWNLVTLGTSNLGTSSYGLSSCFAFFLGGGAFAGGFPLFFASSSLNLSSSFYLARNSASAASSSLACFASVSFLKMSSTSDL